VVLYLFILTAEAALRLYIFIFNIPMSILARQVGYRAALPSLPIDYTRVGIRFPSITKQPFSICAEPAAAFIRVGGKPALNSLFKMLSVFANDFCHAEYTINPIGLASSKTKNCFNPHIGVLFLLCPGHPLW
jgi:hypothetical protein